MCDRVDQVNIIIRSIFNELIFKKNLVESELTRIQGEPPECFRMILKIETLTQSDLVKRNFKFCAYM
jgi:hypothetical protein